MTRFEEIAHSSEYYSPNSASSEVALAVGTVKVSVEESCSRSSEDAGGVAESEGSDPDAVSRLKMK